jgi:hypothetical protein
MISAVHRAPLRIRSTDIPLQVWVIIATLALTSLIRRLGDKLFASARASGTSQACVFTATFHTRHGVLCASNRSQTLPKKFNAGLHRKSFFDNRNPRS